MKSTTQRFSNMPFVVPGIVSNRINIISSKAFRNVDNKDRNTAITMSGMMCLLWSGIAELMVHGKWHGGSTDVRFMFSEDGVKEFDSRVETNRYLDD